MSDIREVMEQVKHILKNKSIVDEITNIAWLDKRAAQLEQAVDLKISSLDERIKYDIINEIMPTLEKYIDKAIKNLTPKKTK